MSGGPVHIANVPLPVNLNSDTAASDAFGRLRVSNPETLFDSKNVFDDSGIAASAENLPLYYDNQELSGGGTATAYDVNQAAQSLSVSANTAGVRARQTKRRFNYQPGKSLLVIMSFTFGAQAAGITQREGMFDANNGLFFEDNGTTYSVVRRTKATGSVVDHKTARADWNVDPMDGTGRSGIRLDFTKTQLLYIDFEWLGVGRVRMGWVVDGVVYICHQMLHTNVLSVVYMSTPNLPLRSEITNSGSGPARTMVQICATVISEGAQDPTGEVRYLSTAGTHVDANTENTIYEVMSIRLRQDHIGMTIQLLEAMLQIQTASHLVEWMLIFNPTIAGTPTYTGLDQSGIEYHLGATANTVTGGYQIAGGFAISGSTGAGRGGAISSDLKNSLVLGSTIAGASDVIALCVRPIAGSTNVDVEGGLSWRELS